MIGRWVPREDLTGRQCARMLELMQRHFAGVTEDRFLADLAEKTGAVLLEDEARIVRGFSTLQVYDSQAVPVRVAYSGDTIVEESARSSPVLARTWIASARELGADVWLLITSGFRTYRFLPVFWREFWPRWDAPATPPRLEELARERFGNLYSDGIVRFAHPHRLRATTAEIPSRRRSDPHIAFFAQRNAGWRDGDELVCLCPLAVSNLTSAGERMVTANDCVAG